MTFLHQDYVWASGSQAVYLLFVYLINTVLANLVVLWGFLNGQGKV